MNPNVEAHFTELPQADIGRSKFNIPFTHLDSFNSGELVPELVMEVLPGDTCKMAMSSVIRMMTPIAPVMDNCFMDVSFWFVPNRLVWSNWKRFMGENETAPWTSTYDGKIPVNRINGRTWNDTDINLHLMSQVTKGSIANHMGIPFTNYTYETHETKLNALPFRGYSLIWNEFWRDQNLQNPVLVPKDDTTYTICTKDSNASYASEDVTKAWVTKAHIGGTPCLPVCKLHDYFTSCLPGVQKGSATTLPMNGTAPIKTSTFKETGHSSTFGSDSNQLYYLENPEFLDSNNFVLGDKVTIRSAGAIEKANIDTDYIKTGKLYADLSAATGATITALRQAFAIQKYLERDARSGTRYIEWLQAHFGVTNPDYRLQRPEYLGGFRQMINMNQVVQSTQVVMEGDTPLGTTGAYSVTADKRGDIFTHSFTEHGYLFCLIAVRNENTYQQGIDRMWFRDTKFSIYTPEFANLSEQAVLNREIYSQGTSADTEAFGYQEAWAEYRFKNSQVTGELSSLYSQPLDVWHYADYYSSKPTLGDKWIQADKNNIQRTLAVQNHDQFMGDFYFDMVWTRPMPLYSVPGLIDHH